MATLNTTNLSLKPTPSSLKNVIKNKFRNNNISLPKWEVDVSEFKVGIYCLYPSSSDGIEEKQSTSNSNSTILISKKNKMEEYNNAMKSLMKNPYEYHHELGMNYTLIHDDLIVGSQPQKPEDIDHLKENENVAYILNLQQDKDIEYWGIDFNSILNQCEKVGICHMRKPAKDFDPDSLRNVLPRAVSALEYAISKGKGKVYVHCTAGLGRAPAVAIAYMFWFCGMNEAQHHFSTTQRMLKMETISDEMDHNRTYVKLIDETQGFTLSKAYNQLTSKRPCGPNRRAIRAATYDLAKNDPWKEPFESLPEHAFEGVADWERTLIQERVRALRGT